MRIIPAIDIINGQAVRLKQGDFEQKTIYDNNPLEVAQLFETNGLKYLHLVDLDGAKAGQVMNWEILELICKETSLRVDFAGGISSEEMVERAFELGAAQITVGSLSVREPEKVKKWIQQFGGDRIILGADLKNERIAVDGWENESSMGLDAYLEQYSEAEANYLF
ncbi:MAG: HisA/HisF-related TIM barrel protein, partial [Flavobacteriales bacterium]|nr:HisA/HisF-related TIM barrel protein [Flavobacteriales bacterium]